MSDSYELVNIGQLDNIINHSFTLPDSKKTIFGKMFLNDDITLTGSEISFNAFRPGQFIPFDHKHTHYEEIYIFLSGSGECEIDGKKIPVKEGSIINIQPEAVRNVCNTSSDIELRFIVIQTKKDSMNSEKLTHDGVGVSQRDQW